MPNGTVKWFNQRKGYGFISMDGENQDVFVHYSAIKADEGAFKSLHDGDKVSFDVEKGEKGSEARNVLVTEAAPRQERSRRPDRDF